VRTTTFIGRKDDFVRVLAARVIDHQLFADGRFARPDFPGEAFADEDDGRHFGAILRGEITAREQWDAERRKIFRRRNANGDCVGRRARLRFARAPIRTGEIRPDAAHRQGRHGPRRHDAG
jgi:hypothetical protein